jgi:hypothetical protein
MSFRKNNTKGFKIRDKITNMFWIGDYRTSTFNEKGTTWSTMTRLESDLARYIKNANKRTDKLIIPTSWEIVEVELKEEIKGSSSTADILRHIFIKKELEPKSYKFSYFYDRMINLGVANDIEFILELNPSIGKRYIDMPRIKEARAQLRLLGVKTRTFRESQGVFGMMNREQAMKARLVLEVKEVIDLAEIRTKINLHLNQ